MDRMADGGYLGAYHGNHAAAPATDPLIPLFAPIAALVADMGLCDAAC